MAKHSKPSTTPATVRTRRAYFDCRFGQLHLRTAFPTTGGFDEGVPLLCLHPNGASSRTFARFLPEIAEERSVYAPDFPGCGESDPAPLLSVTAAAHAVVDFARDLRLRQIDVLGYGFGAEVAVELARTEPALVRRLVLLGIPALDAAMPVQHDALVLRISLGTEDAPEHAGALPNARFLDLPDYAADLFDAAPKTLARHLGAYLEA